MLYGAAIAKDLLHEHIPSASADETVDDAQDPEAWQADIYFTSPNYQAKKMVFLLFINRA